ncbi:MAG: hypothetical protein H6559_08915 [Lewinellaceae bacterium]|nr:hypothetical protein [Lewinellaceae bacterium]
MARKKLTMDDFKDSRLERPSCDKVKGGYKFGPSGAGYVGSYIWESIDIRSNDERISTFQELTFRRNRG